MIKQGVIVSISDEEVNGKFGAKRVKLSINNQIEVNAYAKKLNNTQLLIEIMTALIGREQKLPIPEPVIAYNKERTEVWFASIDVKHPDLAYHLIIKRNNIENNLNNKAIFKKLAEWNYLDQACVFDQWIANNDRNIGNILFNGKDQFYLIDHNLAMALPFAENQAIESELLDINISINGTDEIAKQRIKANLIMHAESIPSQLPQQIADQLTKEIPHFKGEILTKLINFLLLRATFLSTISSKSINTKQMSI